MLRLIGKGGHAGSSAGRGVTIAVGGSEATFLGQSQGHLYCVSEQIKGNSAQITIWVLEDYDKEEWVMKHSVSSLQLFGSIRWLANLDYTGCHSSRSQFDFHFSPGPKADILQHG